MARTMKPRPKLRASKIRPYALAVTEASTALCKEVLPVGGEEQPFALTGWRDSSGRCRRVRAEYANGWELNFRINIKGEITSSSARIRLVTTAKELANA